MRGNPPTGRDEDIVARKMVPKRRVTCERFFGCMGFALSVLSTIAETWKHAKQTYPQFLDATSDAQASLRVHVMFWAHEIRSSSDGLQAGSASMKRWPNMRNEGTRITQIAANIHLWSKRLRDCMLVCPGCAWREIALFQHGLARRKSSSVYLSKKLKAWD